MNECIIIINNEWMKWMNKWKWIYNTKQEMEIHEIITINIKEVKWINAQTNLNELESQKQINNTDDDECSEVNEMENDTTCDKNDYDE